MVTTIQEAFNIEKLDVGHRDNAGIISDGKVYIAKTHTMAGRLISTNYFSTKFCFIHIVGEDYIFETIPILNKMKTEEIIEALKTKNPNRIFKRISLDEIELIYEKEVD